MAKLSLRPGSTGVSIDIFIRDNSVTTGAGLTGLVFNSAGLTCYYHRPGAAAVAVSLVTLAAITTAWASGGFKEVDATNMPGMYRLDVPDAVFAAGVRFATMLLKGATNMEPVTIEFDLNSEVNVTHWHGSDLLTGTGPLAAFGIIGRGDLSAYADTSNMTLAVAENFANGALAGTTLLIYSATTGPGQARSILTNTGDAVVLADALTTTLTGTKRYELYGTPPVTGFNAAMGVINNYVAPSYTAPGIFSAPALAAAPISSETLVTGTADSGTTTSMTDAARTEADHHFIGWRLRPNSGAISGEERIVKDNVAGVFTWSRPTTGAWTTNTYELRPAAEVRIAQDNYSTTTIGTATHVTDLGAPVGASISADLQAIAAGQTLVTVNTNIDDLAGLVTAIKAKTDPMTYAVAGRLSVNATHMNNALILGNGTAGNLWRG